MFFACSLCAAQMFLVLCMRISSERSLDLSMAHLSGLACSLQWSVLSTTVNKADHPGEPLSYPYVCHKKCRDFSYGRE